MGKSTRLRIALCPQGAFFVLSHSVLSFFPKTHKTTTLAIPNSSFPHPNKGNKKLSLRMGALHNLTLHDQAWEPSLILAAVLNDTWGEGRGAKYNNDHRKFYMLEYQASQESACFPVWQHFFKWWYEDSNVKGTVFVNRKKPQDLAEKARFS